MLVRHSERMQFAGGKSNVAFSSTQEGRRTFPSWAAGKSNVPYRRSAGEIALPGDCLLRKRGRAMLVPTRSFLRARHSERSEESVPVRRRRVRRRRRTANAERSVPPGRRGRRPLRNVGIVAHAVHRYDGVGARRRFRVFSISFLQSDGKYDMISLRRNQILSLKVCVFTSFGKNTRFGFMYLR